MFTSVNLNLYKYLCVLSLCNMWPNSGTFISWSTYEQWQVRMPSYAYHFIIVLKGFHHLDLFLVFCIRYNNILVESSRCDIISVSWIRNSTHFGSMKFLMRNILSHVEVPNTNRSIIMSNGAKTFTNDILCITLFWHLIVHCRIIVILVRAEGNLVHLCKARTIHLIHTLVASYIPDLYYFVNSYRYCKRTIIWALYGINISLMPL